VVSTEFAVSSESIREDNQITCFSNVPNAHPEDVTEHFLYCLRLTADI